MVRHSLILVTIFTLLLTALAVTQAGWLSGRPARTSGPRLKIINHSVRNHDPFAVPGRLGHTRHWRPVPVGREATVLLTRFRQNLPRHWRDCVLHQ
jgi:hypothetical protein